MTFAKILLVIYGVVTAAFGAWALAAPQSLAGLLGYTLQTPGAVTELRAFYGGLELALGGYWLLAALRRDMLAAGLLSMILVWGFVAASRAIGFAIDGGIVTPSIVALVTEVAGFVLAAAALRRLPAPHRGPVH